MTIDTEAREIERGVRGQLPKADLDRLDQIEEELRHWRHRSRPSRRRGDEIRRLKQERHDLRNRLRGQLDKGTREAAKKIRRRLPPGVRSKTVPTVERLFGPHKGRPLISSFARRGAAVVRSALPLVVRQAAKTFFLAAARFAPYVLVAAAAVLLAAKLLFPEWFTASASAATRRATGPSCDCTNVSAGFLTAEYEEDCFAREAVLKELFAEGGEAALRLRVENGVIVSGEVCDSVTAGPAAWPLQRGPLVPPPAGPLSKPCESGSGLTRECR